jgi:flagellar biosynthesis GTPase FlhF
MGTTAAVLACAWLGVVEAQSGLAALGVDEATARRGFVNALAGGYVDVFQAAKVFKAAPPATRAALVKGAMAWARTFMESAAFKADYDKQRLADVPNPPKFKNTVDEELAAQSAERHRSLENTKKNLEKMTPELRAQMEPTIKQLEAQNEKFDKDPKMIVMMRQGIEMQRASDQKAYEDRIKAHDKRFPADPNVLVARRLQEFLDVSKDVDFDAKLVGAPRAQRFADARYEGKRTEWKLCFRAGKEAVTAAREAAQAWLNALGK